MVRLFWLGSTRPHELAHTSGCKGARLATFPQSIWLMASNRNKIGTMVPDVTEPAEKWQEEWPVVQPAGED